MTSHEILKADVLDILFDNRNKMYGAYELRKHYNQRMGIALGGMLAIVLCFVLFLNTSQERQLAFQNAVPEGPVTIIDLKPLDVPEPKVPEPQRPPIQKVATTQFTPIEIVSDNMADNTVPEYADLINTAIGVETIEGLPTDNPYQPDLTSGTTGANNETRTEPKETFNGVTKAAEFPGGQSAWMAFLNRHLRTPDELQAGDKRTVLVRFTVGAEGSISNFEIVQSGGNAFDNEVIRVLKKMPKWKPAFQNGHNVSVIFTQPVTFMAFEE